MEKLKVIYNAITGVMGKDIVVFDMKGISPLYEYCIVCTAKNSRSLEAMVKYIKDDLHAMNENVKRVEGSGGKSWILIDAGDIIVHIFTKEEREFYDIEKLWIDVPTINLEELIDE